MGAKPRPRGASKKAKNSVTHALAHKLYESLLTVTRTLVGNKTTDSLELDRAGRLLFGERWGGVFSSDEVEGMKNALDMKRVAIVNTQASTEEGENWVGLYPEQNSSTFIAYNSFARASKNIVSGLKNFAVKDADRSDVEQADSETNCGARSLAFLDVAFIDPELAELI